MSNECFLGSDNSFLTENKFRLIGQNDQISSKIKILVFLNCQTPKKNPNLTHYTKNIFQIKNALIKNVFGV